MKSLLISMGVLALAGLAMGREWTSTAGQKIEAELVEVKGAAGAEVAVLKMANGRSYDVPLSQLSAADQTFALTEKEKSSGGADTGAPSVFKSLLKGKLVAVENGRVSRYEMAAEPKYYAFYFSAHWCPPCRAFTPKFVEFYNAQGGKKTDFEVIFMSSDNSEQEMEEYMVGEKMPWPAVSFRHSRKIEEIRKLAGRGIPCLVVVDREGKVLAHSYEGENYRGPYEPMNKIPTLSKN